MYSLIVTGLKGTWNGRPYKLELNRVVREYTDDAIAERYKTLNEALITELKSFPALFAYEQSVKADARVGFLRRISSRASDVRFEYELSSDLPTIPSSELARLTSELDIDKYEMYRTHWAVKEVDLLPVLVNAGLITKKQGAQFLGKLNKSPAVKTALKRGKKMISAKFGSSNTNDTWLKIEKEYDENKRAFGRKVGFIRNTFKREVIFRDIAQAHLLADTGYSKPAVILAGSVIEELLRLFLEYKEIKPTRDNFDGYIQTCIEKELLKDAIHRLTDSVRHFRNLVHLEKEISSSHTISKPNAKGAVASIFTIANDFGRK